MSRKSFLNMMSRVFGWFEEWIAIEEFTKDKYESSLTRLKAYNKKGLFKLADREMRRIEKEIASEKGSSVEKNQTLFRLYHNQYYSDNPYKYVLRGDSLQRVIDHFLKLSKDQSWLLAIEASNWGRVQKFNFSESTALLKKCAEILPQTALSDSLNKLNNTVEHLDPDPFKELTVQLFSNSFTPNTQTHTLFGFYLISYSLFLWNSRKIKDPKIIFELLTFGLESEILLQAGKIPLVRFQNMVTTISTIVTIDEGMAFVEKWANHCLTSDTDATTKLGKAIVYFHHEKYEKIIETLRFCEFDYIPQKVRAQSLMLMAMYEDIENYHDILPTQIYNYKRLLKRHKASESPQLISNNLNLVKLIEDKVKNRYNNKKLYITNYQPIVYPSWADKQFKKEKRN